MAEFFLNNLTSPYLDEYTLTPEHQVTAGALRNFKGPV
jgi:hypothetical protein